MELSYNDYKISITRDENFTINSTDNITSYQNVYYTGNDNDDRYFSTIKIAIKIYENSIELANALICEIGTYSGLTEKTCYIENNKIWICISDQIYCFEIPSLKLNWNKRIDYATNFTINKFEDDFIIHGEVEIVRIKKSGEIVWRFGGRDIWVNLNGKKEFVMEKDKICLIDFENNKYFINYNGVEI